MHCPHSLCTPYRPWGGRESASPDDPSHQGHSRWQARRAYGAQQMPPHTAKTTERQARQARGRASHRRQAAAFAAAAAAACSSLSSIRSPGLSVGPAGIVEKPADSSRSVCTLKLQPVKAEKTCRLA